MIRAQRGLTIAEASNLIGVNRHTLRDLELGRREPYGPTVRKIAEAYGVPVSQLLEEPALPLVEAPGEGPEEEAPPNAPNLEVVEEGPLTRRIPATEETVVDTVYTRGARFIDEALPGASELLEENVGHAHLNVFTAEKLGELVAGKSDDEINQITHLVAIERNYLRRHYNRYFPPKNKQVSREREKQIDICYGERKKVLDSARDLALERVEV